MARCEVACLRADPAVELRAGRPTNREVYSLEKEYKRGKLFQLSTMRIVMDLCGSRIVDVFGLTLNSKRKRDLFLQIRREKIG